MVYWLLGLLVYLNQRYLFEKSLNNLDCVRFIGLFGLFFHVYFSMRSLNKPNKLVYFSMRSLTGQWDSVWFIGLFGLLVYFSTVYFSNGTGITSVRIHRKRSGKVIYSNQRYLFEKLLNNLDCVRFIGDLVYWFI